MTRDARMFDTRPTREFEAVSTRKFDESSPTPFRHAGSTRSDARRGRHVATRSFDTQVRLPSYEFAADKDDARRMTLPQDTSRFSRGRGLLTELYPPRAIGTLTQGHGVGAGTSPLQGAPHWLCHFFGLVLIKPCWIARELIGMC